MNALFQDQRDEIVNAWVDAVFNTYALETTGFLRTQNDPFANPVAHMTREAAGIVYDAVAGEDVDPAQVKKAIDRFVKLRTVQDGTPGQNLGVFLLLKFGKDLGLSLAFLNQMPELNALGLIGLFPLAGLLGLAVSFLISCRILDRKEF